MNKKRTTSRKLENRPYSVTLLSGEVKEITVPMYYDKAMGEWLLTRAAVEKIQATRTALAGIPTTKELVELRHRLGLSQKQMGQLFRIGEKTWTRWESGKFQPTSGSSLIIEAVMDGEICVDYLKRKTGFTRKSMTGGSKILRVVFDASKRNSGSVRLTSSAYSTTAIQAVQQNANSITSAFETAA